jgi:hypothetical protein
MTPKIIRRYYIYFIAIGGVFRKLYQPVASPVAPHLKQALLRAAEQMQNFDSDDEEGESPWKTTPDSSQVASDKACCETHVVSFYFRNEITLSLGDGSSEEHVVKRSRTKESFNEIHEHYQKKSERVLGKKERFLNGVSILFGRNAKQCCYACVGLGEKSLNSSDEKHPYLDVAIQEGHVRCLEKIIVSSIKKNDWTKEIKIEYLHDIYMSLVEKVFDETKMQRMSELLKKHGFRVEEEHAGSLLDLENTIRL